MKFTIVTVVLLGLCLTAALADSKTKFNKKIPVPGGHQILTVSRDRNVATIEQKSTHGSWKTIWNYDMGYIASKVPSERACYISLMNRKEMPAFDSLPSLAQQNNGLNGHGHHTKDVTFSLVRRHVRDLKSYGPDIFSMCRGLPTFVAYEYQGPQYVINQASCNKLDILGFFNIKYCRVGISS